LKKLIFFFRCCTNRPSFQKAERQAFNTQNTFPVRKTKEMSFEDFKAANERALEEERR
jgi:hypothetical protein